MEKFYRNIVLTGAMRNYIKDKVKAPLLKKIVSLASKYPDPTRENCVQPNVFILFDIWDKFIEYENNRGRKLLFDAAFKLLIATYEHDPYYRFRIDWILEEINKRGWQPRSRIPMDCWTEPGAIGVVAWEAVVPVEEADVPTVIKKLTNEKRKD